MPFVNRMNMKNRGEDTPGHPQHRADPCHCDTEDGTVQGSHPTQTHSSSCSRPAPLSAQHHWKDSSSADESSAADLNYLCCRELSQVPVDAPASQGKPSSQLGRTGRLCWEHSACPSVQIHPAPAGMLLHTSTSRLPWP